MRTHRRWIAIAALLLAGCAGAGTASYTEADNKKEIEVDHGNTFTVSLPDPAGKPPMTPSYSPTVLTLVGEKKDEAAHRRTLQFQAKGLGETEIRIMPDFSLKVRVTSSSDRPGMHVHTR